jgi:hypothetical protein
VFVSPLRRRLNSLFGLLLQLRGRWRLRRGDTDTAVVLLERAVLLDPSAYGSLFALGRAHLRRRDVARARGALVRAREASPTRFAEEAGLMTRAEGYDLAALTDVAVPRPAGALAPRAQVTAVRTRRASASAHPFGDCKDLDEYTRFRSMPAITRDEIESTDWDAVIDDLQDG